MDVVPRCPSVFNLQSRAVLEFLRGEKAPTLLYQHQIDAVKNVCEHLNDSSKPVALVVLPTGCGKTGVAVLSAYALNSSRVLVITPSVKISKQLHENFCGSPDKACFLLERGIITKKTEGFICPHGVCITRSQEIPQCKNSTLMIVNAHKIGSRSSVKIDDIPRDGYDLVIVDEAHHYPAPTWKTLVDHFANSRRLFITATPDRLNGEPILKDNPPCYRMSHDAAVAKGIIRNMEFDEIPDGRQGTMLELQKVAIKVRDYLDQHDQEHPRVKHQALVIAQTIDGHLNSTVQFKVAHDAVCTRPSDTCDIYVGTTSQDTLKRFEDKKIRILIIVGKLLEGYDNKHISVVAIVRNIAQQSKVLFTQFVGRAVRKFGQDDPVTAMIVSHEMFKQRGNFEQFDKVAEDDNIDADD